MEKFNPEPFLAETKYCDYKNLLIQNEVSHYIKKYSDKRELALALFYLVRDRTLYRVGSMNLKASDTFIKKGGSCTDNANLLVAFCRSVGIPAGYGVMEVVGPDYFGIITPRSLANRISKKTKHVYAYVFLSNRWIKCDPSDDEPLSLNTQHLNPQSKIVEWNGISDAVLNLNPSHIISDTGPFADIDHIISKKQRKSIYIPVKIANYFIDFLRKHGSKINSIEMIEPTFIRWLRKYHKLYYLLYLIFLKEKEVQGKVLPKFDNFEILLTLC